MASHPDASSPLAGSGTAGWTGCSLLPNPNGMLGPFCRCLAQTTLRPSMPDSGSGNCGFSPSMASTTISLMATLRSQL